MTWPTMPLKRIFTSNITGLWGEEAGAEEVDALCVRVADFDYSRLQVGPQATTFRSYGKGDVQKRRLESGDILIEKSGGGEKTPVGRAVRYELDSDVPAVTSNFVGALRTARDHDSRYWTYVLAAEYATQGTVPFIKQNTGIQNLDLRAYLGRRVPVPPTNQQRAIADYLDHETAEIDAFIADQERLLELSRERIASSRHQRFSPHGRERFVPLRHIMRIENGSGFPVDEQGKSDLELPFFKVGDINKATNGSLKVSDNTVSETTAARLGATVLPRGTIVMAKIGAALFLTRNSILQQSSCIDNNMMGLIPKGTVTSRFLQESLSTLDLKPLGNPGAVPSLNMDWFKESKVWLPDLETQNQVIAEFSREKEATDSLISDVENARNLAKEHKAALIRAAVTGHIDVSQRKRPAAEVLEDKVRMRV